MWFRHNEQDESCYKSYSDGISQELLDRPLEQDTAGL